MKYKLFIMVVSLVLAVFCVESFSCCGNEADQFRYKRVFSLPGSDLLLVEHHYAVDYAGNGVGPGWKDPEAATVKSIKEREIFDYVIYDADLKPRAGILKELVYNYTDSGSSKVAFFDLYSKIGELPKSVEDSLKKYQTTLNARIKLKIAPEAPTAETALGAMPLSPAKSCPFETRLKDSSLTVLFSDKITGNKLPVGEFDVQSGCFDNDSGDPAPATVESLRCYGVGKDKTWIVVETFCNSSCLGKYKEIALAFSAAKLEAMRENILGYRAYKEKNWSKARDLFLKSLKIDADYPHANFNLVCTLSIMGKDWTSAKDALELLLSKTELRKNYLAKIKSDPDLEGWRKKSAFNEWVDSTAAKYETVVRMAKASEAQTLNSEGMRFYQRKEFDKAIQKFVAAAQADSQYLVARTNAASVYALLDRPDMAIEWLKEAMKISKIRTQKRIRDDRDYAKIRGNKEFQKLLQQ